MTIKSIQKEYNNQLSKLRSELEALPTNRSSDIACIATSVDALAKKTKFQIAALTPTTETEIFEIGTLQQQIEKDQENFATKIVAALAQKPNEFAYSKLQEEAASLFNAFSLLCTIPTPKDPLAALELSNALAEKFNEIKNVIKGIPELLRGSLKQKLMQAEEIFSKRMKGLYMQLPKKEKPIPPVGMHRPPTIYNCWAHADFQLLEHIPSFRKQIEKDPVLGPIHADYLAAQNKGEFLNAESGKKIRKGLGANVSSSNYVQEDAAHGLSCLLDQMRLDLKLVQRMREPIEKGKSLEYWSPTTESLLRVSKQTNGRSLSQMIDDQMKKDGYKFNGSIPDALLVHVSRAGFFVYQDEIGREIQHNTKDMTPLKTSFYSYLPGELASDDKGALSKIKGAIIHVGEADCGHYFCVVEKEGEWSLINDAKVVSLTQEEAKKYLAHADIYYMEKILDVAHSKSTQLEPENSETDDTFQVRG